MYPLSSQRRYWTFGSETEIAALRLKHNQEFIGKHGAAYDVCIVALLSLVLRYRNIFSIGITTAPILPDTRRGTNSAEKLRTAYA